MGLEALPRVRVAVKRGVKFKGRHGSSVGLSRRRALAVRRVGRRARGRREKCIVMRLQF